MCVILIKNKGVKAPSKDILRKCWDKNPDGAGFMYVSPQSNNVILSKGYMNFNDFYRQVSAFSKNDIVVYHFRISTQAGVNPEMTQPFPLTKDKERTKALDLTCKVGIAHNGIIPCTSNGDTEYSDTALFITEYLPHILHKSEDFDSSAVMDIIKELIGRSKFVFLHASGRIDTIGEFTEKDGILYSNMLWDYSFGYGFTKHHVNLSSKYIESLVR